MKSLVLIHGEELLTKLEAADRVRAEARRQGFEERVHHVVEARFDWQAALAGSDNLSLFASRRILEFSFTGEKLGTEAAEAIAGLIQAPPPDTLIILSLPKLDRAQLDSAWYKLAARRGEVIAAPLIEREQLPGWVRERLRQHGFAPSDEVVALLVERCEGHLLAAKQEIDKLSLLLPPGPLDLEAVAAAVADVARYDPAELSEAFLSGDLARYARVLAGLKAEGEQAPRLTWLLAEDIHALASLILARRDGIPLAQALRTARVWGKRQQAMERALHLIPPSRIAGLIQRAARLDAQGKGQVTGDAWLTLAGMAAYAHAGLELAA